MNDSLRAAARIMVPVVRLGKNGLSDGIFHEISMQLKRKQLIKIKILRGFPGDKEKTAEKISAVCGAQLVQVVGNVIILWKDLNKADKIISSHGKHDIIRG